MSIIKDLIDRAMRGESRPVRICADDQANEAIVLLLYEVVNQGARIGALERDNANLRMRLLGGEGLP
jgi:hypothetical protein